MENVAALSLHIPEPSRRPGEAPDFSRLRLSEAGVAPRPPIDAPVETLRAFPDLLIRVLDGQGRAVGPWADSLSAAEKLRGLGDMVLTRAFDERMYRAQRQGKTSFYMKCTGEEAVACAQAHVFSCEDMGFPTYRQQGLLIARGYPLSEMMNQIYSNAGDPIKGRQLPIMYSSRDYGFFSISGNLGTQLPQAVGWAMASAYSGDTKIASAWIGDGATAEGDFHAALTFASVYRAPVVLNVVNNQWAISSFVGIAGGLETSFAAKGSGYGLPALRVDGNDYLAVHAATSWAAARARANLGATLIEFVTYRAAQHSTSDDPLRYRPADEAALVPLGDPIQRLKAHLVADGALDEDAFKALEHKAHDAVRAAARIAEGVGTLGQSRVSSRTLFEDVFKEPDWRLKRQRQSLGI